MILQKAFCRRSRRVTSHTERRLECVKIAKIAYLFQALHDVHRIFKQVHIHRQLISSASTHVSHLAS